MKIDMTKPPVIGIVFDGAVVVDRQPALGEPVKDAIKFIRGFHALGASICIITDRKGAELQAAKSAIPSSIKRLTFEQGPYPCNVDVIVDAKGWGTPTVLLPPKKKNIGVPPYVNWAEIGPNILDYVRRRMQTAKV